jgi:hypothetical protein
MQNADTVCVLHFSFRSSYSMRTAAATRAYRLAAATPHQSRALIALREGLSLREALGTPESVRTATDDRSPLGSLALSRPLNLAEALSRLTLSGDLCRHASNASLRERPFTDVS